MVGKAKGSQIISSKSQSQIKELQKKYFVDTLILRNIYFFHIRDSENKKENSNDYYSLCDKNKPLRLAYSFEWNGDVQRLFDLLCLKCYNSWLKKNPGKTWLLKNPKNHGG